MGVAGAFSAAMLGAKLGRIGPLSISILGTLAPLFFLFGTITPLMFALVVCLYNYAWNLTHPFLLAAIASFDPSSRLIVYAVAAQMLGLANGPWIAAKVYSDASYDNVIWLGIILFAISLIFILPAILKQQEIAAIDVKGN